MNSQKATDDKNCKFCGNGWIPLFRIIDNYPCGEVIDFFHECDSCERMEEIRKTDDTKKDCDDCEYQPYQPNNSLDITVAVIGDRLMFEDKQKMGFGNNNPHYGKWKRTINIHYCPMCGRELEK